MSFTYRTGTFEGPLELLLSLIESEKMPVSELSLAHVAEEFLAYVRSMSQFDQDSVSRFLAVASTLLLLKARALLPILEVSEEEDADIEQLERRLQVYNAIVRGSELLRHEWLTGNPLFVRDSSWQSHPSYIPDDTLTAQVLHDVCRAFLDRRVREAEPGPQELHELQVRSMVKLEEVMERLQERIFSSRERFTLSSTIQRNGAPQQVRADTIVSFLAILELVRGGLVAAEQSDDGNIWLQSVAAEAMV